MLLLLDDLLSEDRVLINDVIFAELSNIIFEGYYEKSFIALGAELYSIFCPT